MWSWSAPVAARRCSAVSWNGGCGSTPWMWSTHYLASIAESIKRIADHLVPPPSDCMDSSEVARLLGGCTTTWVAEMARAGKIPKHCVVAGTGNGKPWKFHRGQIERWIEEGRPGAA